MGQNLLNLKVDPTSEKKIILDNEKLGVDPGETVNWQKLNPGERYTYTIKFFGDSPFKEHIFKIGKNGDTGDHTIIYDPHGSGQKSFKYSVFAVRMLKKYHLDPELIIPRNPKKENNPK